MFNNTYFIQEKQASTLGEKLLFLLKAPFLLPRWVISFLLARGMTNIILSPTYAGPQKSVHPVYLSDNLDDKGIVVVNVVPHDSYKMIRDYFHKFCSVFRIPLAPKRKQRSLSNPEDKARIDHLISELGLLIKGQSKHPKCEGKKFQWDDIYLKGIEYLDVDLRSYLFAELRNQHGSVIDIPHELNLEFYSLETADDAVLDSVAVSTAKEKKLPMSERTFVITCLANGQNYISWLKDLKSTVQEIGCTAICFNYRGIDYSQGMIWTEENMIDDVLAQVKNLLALGAKPEHIGLEGTCLGGGVATLAAARLHEDGLRVKLHNERAFRSIPRTLAGTFLPGVKQSLWNPLSWVQYLFAAVIFVVSYPFIWLAGWRMDIGSAWDKIPQEDKGYSVVRNLVDADSEAPKEDGVVEDSYASLASLVDGRRECVRAKKQTSQVLSKEETLLAGDSPEPHHFKVDPSFDLKGKYPHTIPRRYLVQSSAKGTEAETMHQYMAHSLRNKFFKPEPARVLDSQTLSQEGINAVFI